MRLPSRARQWGLRSVLVLVALLSAGEGGALVHSLADLSGSRAADAGSAKAFSAVTLPRSRAGTFAETPGGGSWASAASWAAPVTKRTALIVGINHASGSRPLQGAVRDAELLEEALLRYGFAPEDVTVLTEREATAARIMGELDALAARTPDDGRAVFMFAGHTRKRGGGNHFVAADGNLVSAGEVASRLARVRAPMWVVLPTCYAGGYGLPGIVGPGRVTTFASSGTELAYELGGSGSYLVIHMVEYAMLDAGAPDSVEESFAFAEASIGESRPDRVPSMDDGYPGEFVLGPVTWGKRSDVEAAPGDPPASADPAGEPEAPSPGPKPRSRPPARVCGAVAVNCRR